MKLVVLDRDGTINYDSPEYIRSAAALELWRDRLADAVVAVGNAPEGFWMRSYHARSAQ